MSWHKDTDPLNRRTLIISCFFHSSQFSPMEASYAAEVPEVKYAPNLMPLFRRQYDNNIFTGNHSHSVRVRPHQGQSCQRDGIQVEFLLIQLPLTATRWRQPATFNVSSLWCMQTCRWTCCRFLSWIVCEIIVFPFFDDTFTGTKEWFNILHWCNKVW